MFHSAGSIDSVEGGSSTTSWTVSITDHSLCDTGPPATPVYNYTATWSKSAIAGTGSLRLFQVVWSGAGVSVTHTILGNVFTDSANGVPATAGGTLVCTLYGVNNAGVTEQIGSSSITVVNPCP